eukprot:5805067-Prymnesium_polylepis.1
MRTEDAPECCEVPAAYVSALRDALHDADNSDDAAALADATTVLRRPLTLGQPEQAVLRPASATDGCSSFGLDVSFANLGVLTFESSRAAELRLCPVEGSTVSTRAPLYMWDDWEGSTMGSTPASFDRPRLLPTRLYDATALEREVAATTDAVKRELHAEQAAAEELARRR